MPLAVANARDPAWAGGAIGDGVVDNASAFAAAYAAIPGPNSGGTIYLPAGTYKAASFPQLAKNNLRIIGEGQDATIIKPTHSSGYFFDLQSVGKFHLEGVTIDGTGVTGTGQGLRLGASTSRSTLRDVCFKNFNSNGFQYVCVLDGTLDNSFYNVDFENNGQHLRLVKNTLPSNQNNFYSCKFQTAQWSGAVAVEIDDAEGNLFDGCLIQGNLGLNSVAVVITAGGRTARGNIFRDCWLEDNGNLQPSSHGFLILGFGTSDKVVGTIIDGCKLFSSAQDKPTSQIFLQNADSTIIDNCHANLGSPNKSVEEGTGVTNTKLGRGNNFAGVVAVTAPTVASAATIAIPFGAEYMTVTGTANITSITATYAGHRASFQFTGNAAGTGLTAGSNLKIGVNFVYTADDAITLVCDGTNWYRPAAGAAN